jgi:hypothetical protein
LEQKIEYVQEEKLVCEKVWDCENDVKEKKVCEVDSQGKEHCDHKYIKECHEKKKCEKHTVRTPHHKTVKVPFQVCS